MTLRLPATWPLAGLGALLALLWLAELLPGAAPVMAPRPAGRPMPAAVDRSAAQTSRWTMAILARPLFRADRRPAAAAVVAVDQPPPRLSAIVITASGRNAIFMNADGTASVLAVGGQSGGYQVQAISADSVCLRGPQGVLNLHPQFNGLGAGAGIGGAAAATSATPAGTLAPPASRFEDN